ncbi:MAG: ORF6N domain-containing protein [Deltaproteobacteria bacterium]|nr:ORF6N domain-containing protein [Deltaproteobacteria bacterium]
MTDANIIVPVESVERTILMIRGQKVMIDADLAKLYGVTTKRLNEQIRRNRDRFPNDFMFQLTAREKNEVVANCDHLAFTEHGAIMAASVLNTRRAIEASIFVVRAFVKLRELLTTHKELAQKLADLERRLEDHDEQFKVVFDAIRALMVETEKPKRKIGFEVKEPKGRYGKRTKNKHS